MACLCKLHITPKKVYYDNRHPTENIIISLELNYHLNIYFEYDFDDLKSCIKLNWLETKMNTSLILDRLPVIHRTNTFKDEWMQNKRLVTSYWHKVLFQFSAISFPINYVTVKIWTNKWCIKHGSSRLPTPFEEPVIGACSKEGLNLLKYYQRF